MKPLLAPSWIAVGPDTYPEEPIGDYSGYLCAAKKALATAEARAALHMYNEAIESLTAVGLNATRAIEALIILAAA